MAKRWITILVFLLMLTFFSYAAASFFSLVFGEETAKGNVALIPINGAIMSSEDRSYLAEPVATAKDIVDAIEKADANQEILALVLDISSPGGSAVASQEVATAVQRANKTVYAFIHEQGTSGAYWVASAADKIIVNELAITGSIGVISSYLDFSGLLRDYNVTYQRLVAGRYKDIGTPFRKLTQEEEQLLQRRLDAIHERFILSVAENRHLPKEQVTALATGMFYLGSEAKDIGLADAVGDMSLVTETIKADLKLEKVDYVTFKKQRTLLDVLDRLSGQFGFSVGQGLATPKTESILMRT